MAGRRSGSSDRADVADRLADTHEQLTAAVQALTADGQWARMLATAAKFPRYSASNVLLIMMQRPDATKVAGLRTWNSLGRRVIKGEKSIAILAPCTYPARDSDTGSGKTSSDKAKSAAESQQVAPTGSAPTAGEVKKPRELRGFRVARVFDVSQTEGADLPAPPPELRLAGAAPPGMWDALAQLIATDGYTLERADTGTADGWTNYATRTVRIPTGAEEAHATLTLSHEIGHIRAEHGSRFAGLYATSAKCRGLAEVEAESIAYLVARAAGLPADAASVPYVASWANGDVDLLRATAARVVSTARAILTDADLLPPTLDALAASASRPPAVQAAGFAATAAASPVAAMAATATAATAVPPPDAVGSMSRAMPQTVLPVVAGDVPPAHRLIELNDLAAAYFTDQYAGSWAARHLRARLGSDLSGARWFRPGFAPAGWTNLVDHLRAHGATGAEILAAGLASRSRTGNLIDRFRDRLMMPIRAADMSIVGFIGRANPDASAASPKYLNTAQTPIFHKGEQLFGWAESAAALRLGARPVLVEGVVDALAVTVAAPGEFVGVAPLGTAFTEAHTARLARYAREASCGVVVATDADDAGYAAAERAFWRLAPHGANLTRAQLPAGSDPAQLLQESGPAAVCTALRDARPLADSLIDQRIARYASRLDTVEGKLAALHEAVRVVAVLPPAQWLSYADQLTARLDVCPGTAHNLILDAGLQPQSPPQQPVTANRWAPATRQPPASGLNAHSVAVGR